jgi:phosphoribosylaminoimidazole carboxylase PurE protein
MADVAIVMGSMSDWDVMKDACNVLEKYGVSYEKRILSAHRTPLEMIEYSKNAKENGFKVIIAGAGGAAHLPGMFAAMTPLPVIGVPVRTRTAEGLDSLLSIVQMPRGVPVATVAINNSTNAALLSIEILALNNQELQDKIVASRQQQEKDIHELNKNWMQKHETALDNS